MLRLAEPVAQAIANGAPVVALESTIVTHGMPYPANLETARAVEAEVRAAGAVPATIAVLDGAIRVGLDDGSLERLARSSGAMKLSRADLAYAVAAGSVGSTTVAATMICAQRAGIGVFATGGIGGVHRGVESTGDVSADLQEFARTAVTVVCAGAKALLDLPRTLEYLETLGVPVLVYRSSEFPAFWSRSSGLPAPLRVETPAEIAAFLGARRELQLEGGVLVAQPIDVAHDIPRAEIDGAIERAVDEARAHGIGGKAVTPWLLDRMLALTGGRSLEANVALVRSNARLAAEIAVESSNIAKAGPHG